MKEVSIQDWGCGVENKHHNGIITSSGLRVWWLVRMCGYKVTHAVLVPKQGLFQRLTYTKTWWLESSSGEGGG